MTGVSVSGAYAAFQQDWSLFLCSHAGTKTGSPSVQAREIARPTTRSWFALRKLGPTRIPNSNRPDNSEPVGTLIGDVYFNLPSWSRTVWLPGMGSACLCTAFHAPSLRRKISVTRSAKGTGAWPPTDTVMRSKPTAYARSPLAPAACGVQ